MEPRSPTLQVDSLPAEPQGSPKILEWVAYPFSSRSSLSRNQTGVSCILGVFFRGKKDSLAGHKATVRTGHGTTALKLGLFVPFGDFPVAQLVKNPPAMRETWVRSLGWEDPLEKGKATHSGTFCREFHGLYSLWGPKESDKQRLSLTHSLIYLSTF